MKTPFTLSILAALSLGTAALAAHNGQDNGQDNGQKYGREPSAQVLSFEDVKAACQNPARFHNQVAPTNIQVSCKEIQRKWVPDQDGSVSMPTSRYITTSVFSDKYTVNPRTDAVPCSGQVSACPQYVEVAETVETVLAVDCDELVAFAGTGAEFCAAATTSLRSANAQAVSSQATGKKVSLCGESASSAQRGQH